MANRKLISPISVMNDVSPSSFCYLLSRTMSVSFSHSLQPTLTHLPHCGLLGRGWGEGGGGLSRGRRGEGDHGEVVMDSSYGESLKAFRFHSNIADVTPSMMLSSLTL